MSNTYLYGLTVQGIQSYIFDTNKLKEIIGASEIIEQMCTTWFKKFIEDKKITDGVTYLQAAGNIRYQTTKENAEKIFTDFHRDLLQNAPGVPFSQAVVEIKENDYKAALESLDSKLSAQRNIPMQSFDLGNMARFIARGTGEAAIEFIKDEKIPNERESYDAVTSSKYLTKTAALTEKIGLNYTYPTNFEKISDGGKHSWLALVHIDGNGMGNYIRKLISESKDNPFPGLKEFSKNIESCTIAALKAAIEETFKNEIGKQQEDQTVTTPTLPFRPLIIDGDDVTAIMRADFAIPFVQHYLEAFEKETKTQFGEGNHFTACAGIAFVKEKFPFHFAAELAENLTKKAKIESERIASCLLFHRVQDSFVSDYDEIRKREFYVNNAFSFNTSPYFINDKDAVNGNSLTQLLEDCKKLNQEDSPASGMREWVNLKFNNPTMTEIVKKRLTANYKNSYEKILNKEKSFIDYQTLLAVNTQIP